MTENRTPYPVRVDGVLDQPVSRWLRLVTWLLLVPHYVCLVLLWLAFLVVSVVAFFAIRVTGRYPRPLYDFVVGMDRWALRVAAYAALMTDEYPPFRLDQGGTDPVGASGGPVPPAPSAAAPTTPPRTTTAPPVPAR